MLHPSEFIFSPLDIDKEHSHSYKILQDEITVSNQFPYKYFALLVGISSFVFSVILAAFLRALFNVKPDKLTAKLAEEYYCTPAMALHKKIEIDQIPKIAFHGRVLDIGCGGGIVGSIIKDICKIEDLSGLDVSLSHKNLTAKNGYNDFYLRSATDFDFSDRKFDSLMSICVLEHIKDLNLVFDNISKSINTDGTLFFTTPSPEFRDSTVGPAFYAALGLQKRKEAAARHKDAASMQYHYYSRDFWNSILTKHGFTDIRIKPFFSRKQLIIYDLMNFEVIIPKFYFANKMPSIFNRSNVLKKLAIWSTSIIVSFFSKAYFSSGIKTHWAILARYDT